MSIIRAATSRSPWRKFVDKVRINPGLFVFRKPRQRADEYTAAEFAEEQAAIEASLLPVIKVCKERDIAMRIGVNHGSWPSG